MSRPGLALVLLFLILFAAVTWMRSHRDDEVGTTRGAANADHVRGFWEAYRRATDARMGGEWETAVRSYREALTYDPSHQDSLFYLSVCLEALGRYREALTVLEELTTRYPEHGRGFSQLGSLLATRAPGAVPDLERAEAAFVRSQEINQEHSGPFVSRGRIALEEGRYEDARRLFGIAAGTGAPLGVFYAGLTEFLLGNDDAALGFFERVIGTSSREKAITDRGSTSEGDARVESLTPLERAHLLCRAFALWADERRRSVERSGALYELLFESAEEGRGTFVDYDGDGRQDVAVAGPGGVVLYRNLGGGRFELHRLDSEKAWDIVTLDVEGDGDPDLYVVGSGYLGVANNRLYLRKEGAFVDATEGSGLGGARSTNRAIARDFDGDGNADLLEVGNNLDEGHAPVRLYLRHGSRFDESAEPRNLSMGVQVVDAAAADVDGDGGEDVFLLGFKGPGRLFHNAGERFEDWTASAGLEGVRGEGMSVTFLDLDRDGDPDLLVTSYATLEASLLRLLDSRRSLVSSPRLFRNDDGRFTEVTTSAGLDRSFGVMQATPADVDGDGFVDLVMALGGLDVDRLEPSVMLRNVNGERFETFGYLPSEHSPGRALGASTGDVDGDGRVDIFLAGVGLFRSLGSTP
jgi:tetratricopeptide (TPR) repeat protein